MAATGCFAVARSESLINMALLNHVRKEMIAYLKEIATCDLVNLKGSRENTPRDLYRAGLKGFGQVW